MNGKGNALRAELIRLLLGDCNEKISLTLLEETDSTNSLLCSMAESGAPEWSVVIAGSQSGGRGRKGRSFFSPDGGLYMSVLFRPSAAAANACSITCETAVAVCRAIEKLSGKSTGIKWVNDILIDGRKVCGILTEGRLNGACSSLEYAVVGIGVNVFAPTGGFPDEIKNIAGALFDKDISFAREKLAAEIILQLLSPAADTLGEYRRRSVLPGKRINVLSAGKSEGAKALYIDDSYALVVSMDSGELRALSSGEVSVREELKI